MALKLIQYTKVQRRGMAVSGYSLYVNGSYLGVHEYFTLAKNEADRYSTSNDVEIYPVLKRRY